MENNGLISKVFLPFLLLSSSVYGVRAVTVAAFPMANYRGVITNPSNISQSVKVTAQANGPDIDLVYVYDPADTTYFNSLLGYFDCENVTLFLPGGGLYQRQRSKKCATNGNFLSIAANRSVSFTIETVYTKDQDPITNPTRIDYGVQFTFEVSEKAGYVLAKILGNTGQAGGGSGTNYYIGYGGFVPIAVNGGRPF